MSDDVVAFVKTPSGEPLLLKIWIVLLMFEPLDIRSNTKEELGAVMSHEQLNPVVPEIVAALAPTNEPLAETCAKELQFGMTKLTVADHPE